MWRQCSYPVKATLASVSEKTTKPDPSPTVWPFFIEQFNAECCEKKSLTVFIPCAQPSSKMSGLLIREDPVKREMQKRVQTKYYPDHSTSCFTLYCPAIPDQQVVQYAPMELNLPTYCKQCVQCSKKHHRRRPYTPTLPKTPTPQAFLASSSI